MNVKSPARALPDEADHVFRARKGDKDAYRYLVEGYEDRLFVLAVSLVHNSEQAEDLIQEIFVKAYFALPSFEGHAGFYTWLYRIASNHCLDYLRKRRPEQVSLERPVKDGSDMTFEDTLEAPSSDHPDAALAIPSEGENLLNALEPDQRIILTLRELDGYSYEELAEMLNCPVNTIKSRLNRAREALKEAYTRIYGPPATSLADGGNISDRNIVLEGGDKP